MSEKPYWFPVRIDEEYYDRLRKDYPDKANWSIEELVDYFNDDGFDFEAPTLWDHTGDATDDYEPLADAFLDLLSAAEGIWNAWKNSMNACDPEAEGYDELQSLARAIMKARGE